MKIDYKEKGFKRYVRTLDGIYDLEGSDYSYVPDGKFGGVCWYFTTKNSKWVKVRDIIKQSDKIEDLLDLIVCEDINEHRIYKVSEARELYDNGVYQKIFGAVWTRGGLSYIAELNIDKEFFLTRNYVGV